MGRACDCEPGCKPLGGSALLSPGIVWADVVREIEQEATDPYGTGDLVPADLWGRRRTEETQ